MCACGFMYVNVCLLICVCECVCVDLCVFVFCVYLCVRESVIFHSQASVKTGSAAGFLSYLDPNEANDLTNESMNKYTHLDTLTLTHTDTDTHTYTYTDTYPSPHRYLHRHTPGTERVSSCGFFKRNDITSIAPSSPPPSVRKREM